MLEKKLLIGSNNILLNSILKFGLLPFLFFLTFLLSRYYLLNIKVLIGYFFSLLWVATGPYFIWLYEKKLMPSFFLKMKEIIIDKNVIKTYEEKYSNFFAKQIWPILAIFWTSALFYFFLKKIDFFIKFGGIHSLKDYFVILAIFGIAILGILHSIGFGGVITTIALIYSISREEIIIDPYNEDNLGGLSIFGYYAIGTTLLFSSGTFFLPLAFQMIFIGNKLDIFFIILPSTFSIFILLSFFIPTIVINRHAKKVRDRILSNIRYRINKLKADIKNDLAKDNVKIIKYFELNMLIEEFKAYRNVKLYPLEIEIFLKLIGSFLLPLIFTLMQIYL